MIYRDDMLELTRRMTPTRTSFTRVAGAYFDEDGNLDNTVNIHFLKLKNADKEKMLKLAKAIPFSESNKQLLDYEIPQSARGAGSMQQMLNAILKSGLKNDALLLSFYEYVGENILIDNGYGMFLFHDCYDVPSKGTDKERQWESEYVFEYLICSIFPIDNDYEPCGEPICGFLYPGFANRYALEDHIAIYNEDPERPMYALNEILGV